MSAVKIKTSEGVRIPQQVSFASPMMSFGNRHGACSSDKILFHYLSWFALQNLDIPPKGWVRSSDLDYSCWGLGHDVGFPSPRLNIFPLHDEIVSHSGSNIIHLYNI